MKKVLYVILGLLVGYLVLCIAGPSKATAERSITVNASAEQVKTQLQDLHFFQEKWSPWSEKDPNMKVTYSGETGNPGNSYAWESDVKEVGKGSLAVVGVNGDSLLETLSFEGMGASRIYFISSPDGAATKVSWGMQSNVPFFGRAVMMFMNMDKMIGPDFEKGLNKFKMEVEAMGATPVAANYEVQEIDFTEKNYVGTKKEKMTMDKVGAFFGINFNAIMDDLKKNRVEPTSPPSAIYWNFDEKDMSAEVVACWNTAKGSKAKGWENHEMPAGKALQVTYYGDYMKMMDAHGAIKKYIVEKNLTPSAVIEEYITDPMIEKDTAKWQTNIIYVLK